MFSSVSMKSIEAVLLNPYLAATNSSATSCIVGYLLFCFLSIVNGS